jgi:hypothetical protein
MCPGDSQPPHIYLDGLRNVTCKEPPPDQLSCIADLLWATNTSTLNRLSGWTLDGRALRAVAAGLQAPADLWPTPFPCVRDPPLGLSPHEPAVNRWQGRSHTPTFAHGAPGLPPAPLSPLHVVNTTSGAPAPPPYLGLGCESVGTLGASMARRIVFLDLTGLVERGRLPAGSMRLPPALAQLTELRVLRASGYPMQGGVGGSTLDCAAAVRMCRWAGVAVLRRSPSKSRVLPPVHFCCRAQAAWMCWAACPTSPAFTWAVPTCRAHCQPPRLVPPQSCNGCTWTTTGCQAHCQTSLRLVCGTCGSLTTS